MRQKSFFIIISLILVFSATGLKAQDTGESHRIRCEGHGQASD